MMPPAALPTRRLARREIQPELLPVRFPRGEPQERLARRRGRGTRHARVLVPHLRRVGAAVDTGGVARARARGFPRGRVGVHRAVGGLRVGRAGRRTGGQLGGVDGRDSGEGCFRDAARGSRRAETTRGETTRRRRFSAGSGRSVDLIRNFSRRRSRTTPARSRRARRRFRGRRARTHRLEDAVEAPLGEVIEEQRHPRGDALHERPAALRQAEEPSARGVVVRLAAAEGEGEGEAR
eukprot:8109-Pelagococcus_subviridis.AAC.6